MNLHNLFENQDQGSFRIGDPVIITGDVQFKGKTGDVRDVGRDGAFVVVDLYNYGPRSFHSTDVSLNDYADSDDEAEYQQGVEEGLGKSIKRGMAGWGAFDKDKPADVVKRVKGQDTDTLKGLSRTGPTGQGSPAELQQKAIRRELKKRGEQGVAEGDLDEGVGNIVAAFAVAGGLLLGGNVAYQDSKLAQQWMQSYEQIKDSDPDKADRVKKLVNQYKHTSFKNAGTRRMTKQQIEKIIADFNSQSVQEQGVAEGSGDDGAAKAAHLAGLRHGREGVGNNMDRAKKEWGDDFKHYNAGFLKGRNEKAKDLKAVGQGYGKRQQGVSEAEKNNEQPWVDAKLKRKMDYAFGHYAGYRDKPEAFFKWVMNSLEHSEENDQQHNDRFDRIEQEIDRLTQRLNQVNEQYGAAVADRFSQRLAEHFAADRATADPARELFAESRAQKRAAIREIFANQG